MNEKENNAVELKDPQLEKVSGGNSGSASNEGTPSCYEPISWSAGVHLTKKAACQGCHWLASCRNALLESPSLI